MRVRSIVVLSAVVCLAACRTHLEKRRANDLAYVAKDWCLTIRASQVIPVYPLTEDLQVGDIFLVDSPLEDEIQDLEVKGFLPLENTVARLLPAGWQQYYNSAYGVTATSVLPQQWQFPQPQPTAAPWTTWSNAPGAAFPSYTFQVKNGAGGTLAIPIQSIPVGLSLLQTGDASGTVNIASASTYSLPIAVLSPQVDAWAAQNGAFLSTYAPRGVHREQNYLRTVYRVYVAGGVNVSLVNNKSSGARGDAGASKPIALFDAGTTTDAVNAAANYAAMLKSLNDSVASTSFGANVTIAAASSGSVAMNETFPRPLVIGYLAFDRPILDGGQLGPPLSTNARVRRRRVFDAK